MNITLTVYENDMVTVKKECNATTVKIPFGTIRKLMKLFDLENIDDTNAILNIVMSSWNEVIAILNRVFPEMEESDWDTVDTKELISVIYKMLKAAFLDLASIPTDPKN